MTDFISTELFSITVTFVIYFAAFRLYARFRFFFLNPVLITIAVIIFYLNRLGITYEQYNKGGRFISFFLGPSVVALALPLYLKFDEIKKRKVSIPVSIIAGSIVGVLSASITTYMLGGSRILNVSIAPKSVTTPIAMSISEKIGGIPSLTAVLVVITGITGAVLAPLFLKLIGVKSKTAFGLAMGAAAHGIGTARAMEEGELEAGAGGLAICLNGIATALIAPALVKILINLGFI